MKLNKILASAMLTTFVVAMGSFTAFAADGDSFTLGTPYDITTGAEATQITEGHIIAIPVDITSATGGVVAYRLVADYNTDVLSAGVNYSSRTTAEKENLKALAVDTANLKKDNAGLYGGINAMKSYDELDDKYAVVGSSNAQANTQYVSTSNPSAKSVTLQWSYTESVAPTDDPEGYILFTVLKSVDDDALNTSLVTVNADSGLSDIDTSFTKEVAKTDSKANACYGAFKVVLDNDSEDVQSLGWIQKLSAQITSADGSKTTTVDLTEYVNEDGSTVYEFPVRIVSNSSNASTATVEIYADVTSDEAGTQDKDTVLVASTTVSLAGTATSYTELSK
jgi:hypothetical protein